MLSDSWVTTSSLHWPVSLPGFILSSSEHVCCYCEPLLRALWQPSSPPAYANRTPQKTAPTRLHRALGSQPAEPWGRERGGGPPLHGPRGPEFSSPAVDFGCGVPGVRLLSAVETPMRARRSASHGLGKTRTDRSPRRLRGEAKAGPILGWSPSTKAIVPPRLRVPAPLQLRIHSRVGFPPWRLP